MFDRDTTTQGHSESAVKGFSVFPLNVSEASGSTKSTSPVLHILYVTISTLFLFHEFAPTPERVCACIRLQAEPEAGRYWHGPC